MGEIEDFKRRVSRDDYVRHVWFMGLGFGAAVVGIVLCDWLDLPLFGAGFGAPFFFLSGLRAITGKKSAITGVGALGIRARWTTRELEDMSPKARARHAYLTAPFVMSFGVFALLVEGLAGYSRHQRWLEHRADQTRGVIARPVGLESNGIGISDALVCSAGDRVVACFDSNLEMTSPVSVSQRGGDHIAVSGKRVVWSKDRSLELARVDDATATTLVLGDAGGAVSALALGATKLVWIADGTLQVAAVGEERWEPRTIGEGIEAKEPLLVVDDEHAYVSGGAECGLAKFSLTPPDERAEGTCMATKLEPCALALGEGKVFATTPDGDVLSIDAEGRQSTLLNSSGACGLSVANGRVIVISNAGVFSVPTGGGERVPLFTRNDRSPRRHVGLNRWRFYWLEGATLNSVRLEPLREP